MAASPAAVPSAVGSLTAPSLAAGPGLMSAFGVTPALGTGLIWPGPAELQAHALQHNTGDRRWRSWKQVQLQELVELALQTDRVRLIDVKLEGDFNALVWLQAPVPRWPMEGRLRITDHAVLHLNYQSPWLVEPPPGWMPVGVMEPFDVYLPNAAPAPRGALCLGSIPPACPVRELLYLAYLAVTLQTATLDETEGVLNAHACEFFRDHLHFMPLTRTSVLEPWSSAELELHDALFVPGGTTP